MTRKKVGHRKRVIAANKSLAKRARILGEGNGAAVLKEHQVRDILKREHSSYVYAEKYGCADSTVRHIWTGRNWWWVE